jgi:hypothetical protein
MTGPRPNVTQAQILALLVWLGAQAVAWGWLSAEPSKVTLSAAATLLAGAWHYADAHIRHGRNLAHAADVAAQTAALNLAGPRQPA